MQKQSLILALFILALALWLGKTLFPQIASLANDTAKKIRIEQVLKV